MVNKPKHSLINSFRYAGNGIIFTIKSQRNIRIHCVAACLAIALSWYLSISKMEWLWIFLSIALVMITETLNTAVESVVDLATSLHHPLAKHAKDTAAGAVLLSTVFAVMVGTIIFVPKCIGL